MKRKEFRTANGTVRNANIRANVNRKIVVVIGVVILAAASSPILAKAFQNNKRPEISTVPSNKIIYVVDVRAHSGETLSELALKYYNDDCEGVYNSFDNYIDDIASGNNISNPDSIKSGTVYRLPVIIDEDNEYYVEIKKIQAEIDKINKSEKWVSHTVGATETISYYASLASGSYDETMSNIKLIQAHNGISEKDLKYGSTIEILNPKLGQLKMQLHDLMQDLNKSLENNQVKK